MSFHVEWLPAEQSGHPLGRLQGQQINSFTVRVLLGPQNRWGAHYFQLFLADSEGRISPQPVVLGLHHTGKYPSYNWIEIVLYRSTFTLAPAEGAEGETVRLPGTEAERRLFQELADLIPPGGHLMVEYDSPGHSDTERSLAIGVPAVATPLGNLLFAVGCGVAFKDWHFAEGGSEGSRKLQGYKALNQEHARVRAREMAQELVSFLKRSASYQEQEGLVQPARHRAREVLSALGFPSPPEERQW